MRLFVAVPVPGGLKSGVAALGSEIARGGVVPVRPENMHLTLRFLGEVDEGKGAVEGIKAALGGVRFKKFPCTIRGVGAFPNENYVRVVWAGCESAGALESLAADVAGALAGFGGDERGERFSAHMTIARVKRKADLKEFFGMHREDVFGEFTVSEFRLMSSVLGPGGPQYAVLAAFKADDADA
jgi:2'-5' RNA ligase